MIKISKSKIKKAGMGVFATEDIKKGVKLGEYKGVLLNKSKFDKLRSTQYVFEVSRKINGQYTIYYIDAQNKKRVIGFAMLMELKQNLKREKLMLRPINTEKKFSIEQLKR